MIFQVAMDWFSSVPPVVKPLSGPLENARIMRVELDQARWKLVLWRRLSIHLWKQRFGDDSECCRIVSGSPRSSAVLLGTTTVGHRVSRRLKRAEAFRYPVGVSPLGGVLMCCVAEYFKSWRVKQGKAARAGLLCIRHARNTFHESRTFKQRDLAFNFPFVSIFKLAMQRR